MKIRFFFPLAVLLGSPLGLLAQSAPTDTAPVHMEFLPSGAASRIGWYEPAAVELSRDQPAAVKKAPALKSAWFGTLTFGGVDYLIALDQPTADTQTLYLDANGNGDLTDDPAVDWKQTPGSAGDEHLWHDADLRLPLKGPDGTRNVTIKAYGCVQGSQQKFFYYPDYACVGEVTLAGQKHEALLVDVRTTGDFSPRAGTSERPPVQLLLAKHANEQYDPSNYLKIDVAKPFEVDGKTWEVAGLDAGGSFRIVPSDQVVPEPTPKPVPLPTVKTGEMALPFTTTTMDGATVHFPTDYKGKLVLLDFWATWCGACMEDAPGVAKAYAAHHAEGLEILGVTLDDPGAEAKVKKAAAKVGMTWPQVYDGKSWDGVIPHSYGLPYIPAPFLVDGDSGRVVASLDALRGDALEETLNAELKKAAAKTTGK